MIAGRDPVAPDSRGHLEAGVDGYVTFRPTCPPELAAALALHGRLAVDVACVAHVETGYRDRPVPFAALDLPEMAITARGPQHRPWGDVRSRSAARSDRAAPVIAAAEADCAAILPPEAGIDVRFPVFVRVGRVHGR